MKSLHLGFINIDSKQSGWKWSFLKILKIKINWRLPIDKTLEKGQIEGHKNKKVSYNPDIKSILNIKVS